MPTRLQFEVWCRNQLCTAYQKITIKAFNEAKELNLVLSVRSNERSRPAPFTSIALRELLLCLAHFPPPTLGNPTYLTHPLRRFYLRSPFMIMNNSLNIMPTWTNHKSPIVPRMISLPHAWCPMVLPPSLECSLMKRLDLFYIYLGGGEDPGSPPISISHTCPIMASDSPPPIEGT